MAIKMGRPNVRGIAKIPKEPEDDFYTFSDLKNGPKPKREWLIEGLVTTRSINHLVGATSSGKSVIALQLCKSVREGIPFFDFKPNRTGPIVYFGLEDGKVRIDERTEKQGWKKDPKLPEVYFSHSLTVGGLPGRGKLESAIKKYEPVLVVIDPLMLATGNRDINVNKDMSEFARRLRDILVNQELAFFIAHHERKSYDKFPATGDIQSGLGATSSLALSDTRLMLYGKEDERRIRVWGKDVLKPNEEISIKKDALNYTWVRKRTYNKSGGNEGGK